MTRFRNGERGDRPLLQAFRCTRPPKRDADGRRLPSDRPWEAEVEGFAHTLKPPGRPENLIRLGLDDDGDLVSIVVVEALNPRATGQLAEFFVVAVAVATSRRGTGGDTADEAMTDALEQMAERVRAAGGTEFLLTGRIHGQNAASAAMATRNGMQAGPVRNGDAYLLWRTVVEIA